LGTPIFIFSPRRLCRDRNIRINVILSRRRRICFCAPAADQKLQILRYRSGWHLWGLSAL